jgi:hypothetical protein
MLVDRYGGCHSTSSEEAIGEFEKAVFAVAAHRPAVKPLAASLAADPDFVAGVALKGLGVTLLGKAEDLAAGRAALEQARRALVHNDGGTEFERALVEALSLAANGSLRNAAARLEFQVAEHPVDFLCLKLSNALRFMTGEPNRMRAVTAMALRQRKAEDAGHGFVLGLHAFGLEETGAFAEAEAVGHMAVRAEPADIWGVHAVSHVMEMRGRPEEGARWLESSRQLWPLCNNFNFHLSWHLALFHLECARYDDVLDLYDHEIRPAETDDFRDMANAASILWRLEQEGVDVGDRWQRLHAIAYRRRTDTTYVFASLHYLLALLGAGDRTSAIELIENLRQRATSGDEADQSRVAAHVGIAVAEAILSLHTKQASSKNLSELAIRLPAIGGSRAQRDVFLRTLAMMAAESGDPTMFDAVARVRHNMKTEDRFLSLSKRWLAAAGRVGLTGSQPRLSTHA